MKLNLRNHSSVDEKFMPESALTVEGLLVLLGHQKMLESACTFNVNSDE
jgi:hypothetical protein